MRVEVNLSPDMPVRLPFNYQAQLSAAVYSAMREAAPAFADALHGGPEHA